MYWLARWLIGFALILAGLALYIGESLESKQWYK
jgi:hypothetical protein